MNIKYYNKNLVKKKFIDYNYITRDNLYKVI